MMNKHPVLNLVSQRELVLGSQWCVGAHLFSQLSRAVNTIQQFLVRA